MAADQVLAPGGFVPQVAIGFGARDADATAVHGGNPLPIRQIQLAAGSIPQAGSAAAGGMIGPFAPELGRAMAVTLSGSWAGTVTLRRSTDGGATRLPLTFIDGSPKGVWTGNLNVALAEESVAGATYYLDFSRTSGTLVYRMEQ